MKRTDYLKFAIKQTCYFRKAWLISSFSMTRESQADFDKDPYIGRLLKDQFNYTFLSDTGEMVKIEDADINEPLFKFAERLTVDNSWLGSISEPVETSIGTLIFNCICLYTGFGSKFPYQNGVINANKIDDSIAVKLRDIPKTESERSNEYYYVDEYLRYMEGLQLIGDISQLCTYAATRKNLIGPPGVDAFKDQLLLKYKGKLNDPVELSRFEKELTDYDNEYLKGDPSDGKFMSGKVKNIARKKMFLTIGSDANFTGSLETNPVINSLDQGWPTDPKELTSMINGLRVGSYSRGKLTADGGVAGKILLRASNALIVKEDCGTKLGIRRTFYEDNINQLVGRTIIDKGLIKITNLQTAKQFIGKEILVRSPMYCKTSPVDICSVCIGDKLSRFENGLSLAVTELAGIILQTSLSLMHGTVLSTAKLDINKSIT